MNTQRKLDKKQEALQANEEAFDRWFKKLQRAARACELLRKERKRLLAPRKLEANEKQTMNGDDWHKIREQVFSDEIPDFLRRT